MGRHRHRTAHGHGRASGGAHRSSRSRLGAVHGRAPRASPDTDRRARTRDAHRSQRASHPLRQSRVRVDERFEPAGVHRPDDPIRPSRHHGPPRPPPGRGFCRVVDPGRAGGLRRRSRRRCHRRPPGHAPDWRGAGEPRIDDERRGVRHPGTHVRGQAPRSQASDAFWLSVASAGVRREQPRRAVHEVEPHGSSSGAGPLPAGTLAVRPGRPVDRTGVRSRFRGSERGCPSLEEVSTALQQSPRTLKRRLAGEGASFSALRDLELRERAITLVRTSHAPYAEIAARLGYSNITGFDRAFRRWTATTPTECRRAARARTL